MVLETPTFIDAGHQHTVYGLGNLAAGNIVTGTTAINPFAMLGQQQLVGDLRGRTQPFNPQEDQPMPASATPTRRLVQVLIADADENVPLAQSLLYQGGQKLTDATDQELFYEIDIKALLTEHNAARTKLINKKVKERTEYLEPARIRDLKMIVVTVATF